MISLKQEIQFLKTLELIQTYIIFNYLHSPSSQTIKKLGKFSFINLFNLILLSKIKYSEIQRPMFSEENFLIALKPFIFILLDYLSER